MKTCRRICSAVLFLFSFSLLAQDSANTPIFGGGVFYETYPHLFGIGLITGLDMNSVGICAQYTSLFHPKYGLRFCPGLMLRQQQTDQKTTENIVLEIPVSFLWRFRPASRYSPIVHGGVKTVTELSAKNSPPQILFHCGGGLMKRFTNFSTVAEIQLEMMKENEKYSFPVPRLGLIFSG